MQTFVQFIESKEGHGKSFFQMDLISKIEKMDLEDAKEVLMKAVVSSKATDDNKKKAKQMISKCNSVKSLMIGASNFLLSHPENDLSMKKGED